MKSFFLYVTKGSSRRLQIFLKISVLKNLTIFTRKLRPTALLKNDSNMGVFL